MFYRNDSNNFLEIASMQKETTKSMSPVRKKYRPRVEKESLKRDLHPKRIGRAIGSSAPSLIRKYLAQLVQQ